jgi:hypothetical protein
VTGELDVPALLPGRDEVIDHFDDSERTITGSEIADFLHVASIAVLGELPLERLRHAVAPFPTRSEIWLAVLEQASV